jgi:hypothetical protein
MTMTTSHQRSILENSKTSRGLYLDLELVFFVKMCLFYLVTHSLLYLYIYYFVMVFNLAICIVLRKEVGCLTDAQERIKENK